MTNHSPNLIGQQFVTDGGLETDLIFNRGIDLPEFAAFVLMEDEDGRAALRDYYHQYIDIAVAAGVPILLETPTWRASPEWGAKLGFDQAALDRINRESVEFLADLATERAHELTGWEVGGMIGPRGDGYQPGVETDPDECAALHRHQLAAFHAAGATRASVLTMTETAEALGIARAAADVGIPVVIGFTVETDGRLPDGTTLGEAIAIVDADTPPEYYVINCAHPTHISEALDGGDWNQRIGGLRVNASKLSHAELDECEVLDDGHPMELALGVAGLRESFPNAAVIGGCCGTDARHVAAAWGVTAARTVESQIAS
ncbi:MAG: homocysteine S-methyltransferase [Acidimicrobiales bacterium]|nr:homocysteine S-methyltransferase [Acidimicrobiales bacterium]